MVKRPLPESDERRRRKREKIISRIVWIVTAVLLVSGVLLLLWESIGAGSR